MKMVLLRKKHPRFIYQSYSYKVNKGNLQISFVFRIEPDIVFHPKLVIKNIPQARFKKIRENVLNNFVFHLGLIEMLSYWKVVCSPEIIIKAGSLNKEQINWWRNLLISGMGQFFYENKIDWHSPRFLKIKCSRPGLNQFGCWHKKLSQRYLVPIGGGKDSIVTLEKLRKKKTNCFLVNPTKAAKNIVKISGIKNPIIVERKVDVKLLELNKKGYLNGHTPFTALLSFLSVFCAVLFDYRNVAFSNEKSADEGNVRYLGKTINHQYSKSSQFEKKFRVYCQKYLAKNINYSSFLRKYTETEISQMFLKYPKYFSVFSSCNMAAKKNKRWCGQCPKCLFVYAALYPFLEKRQLQQIFNQDLFKKKELLSLMKALIDKGKHKPFECVGTYQESRALFNLSLEKALRQSQGKPLPYLLKKFNEIK